MLRTKIFLISGIFLMLTSAASAQNNRIELEVKRQKPLQQIEQYKMLW